ncbi:hypothetical protein DQW92_01780 [Metamycoplasma hominis]|uniref:hypothetical protein n=1 Tax=Metamycoplasma hominis TaxID=2098 RepID=UPI000DCD5B3A|nr:hypothetical protein [Metamycoplasma hominis]RAW47376.1 hypothetical protein DQW92_01780 [Metamycoplasma hominis]
MKRKNKLFILSTILGSFATVFTVISSASCSNKQDKKEDSNNNVANTPNVKPNISNEKQEDNNHIISPNKKPTIPNESKKPKEDKNNVASSSPSRLQEVKNELQTYIANNLKDFIYENLKLEIKDFIEKEKNEADEFILKSKEILWNISVQKNLIDQRYTKESLSPKSKIDVEFLKQKRKLENLFSIYKKWNKTDMSKEIKLLKKINNVNFSFKNEDIAKLTSEISKRIEDIYQKINSSKDIQKHLNNVKNDLNPLIQELINFNNFKNSKTWDVVDRLMLNELFNGFKDIDSKTFAEVIYQFEESNKLLAEYIELYSQIIYNAKNEFEMQQKNSDLFNLFSQETKNKIINFLATINKLENNRNDQQIKKSIHEEFKKILTVQEEIYKNINKDFLNITNKEESIKLLKTLNESLKEQKNSEDGNFLSKFLNNEIAKILKENSKLFSSSDIAKINKNIEITYELSRKLNLEIILNRWNLLKLISSNVEEFNILANDVYSKNQKISNEIQEVRKLIEEHEEKLEDFYIKKLQPNLKYLTEILLKLQNKLYLIRQKVI